MALERTLDQGLEVRPGGGIQAGEAVGLGKIGGKIRPPAPR
jgi:hypothetical protein